MKVIVTLKQILDSMLGVAIGDAFGFGIEFSDRKWIRENIDFTKFVINRLDGWGKYEVGDWSDDTEMTLAFLKALASGRKITMDVLVEFWFDEFHYNKKRKGHETGHGSFRHYCRGTKTIEQIRQAQADRVQPGNAPPMRAVPIGFLPEELINEYALINADATHPHPKARTASILIARMARYMIVENGNPKKLVPYLMQHVAGIDNETDALLLKVDKLPEPENLTDEDYKVLCGSELIKMKGMNILGMPGYAMNTALCAVYAVKHCCTAFDGLKFSINLGGDIDSIAAPVVGILAGRYGIESLPKFLRDGIDNREYICATSSLFYGWLNINDFQI